jgi:hypothetical protein
VLALDDAPAIAVLALAQSVAPSAVNWREG